LIGADSSIGGISIFSISLSSMKYFAISGYSRLRRSNSVSVIGLYFPLSRICRTNSLGILFSLTLLLIVGATGLGL
jgi:hypothetical protein